MTIIKLCHVGYGKELHDELRGWRFAVEKE